MALPVSYGLFRLAHAVLDGLLLIVRLCTSHRSLHCLDPPVFTSPLLRRLGYGEYDIRRIWREGERRSASGGVVVYECCSSRFTVKPVVRHEPAYHHRATMAPVDPIDCRILGDDCVEITHSKKFFLYIVGNVEDNYLKMNVAHLIVTVARSEPGKVVEIIETARRIYGDHGGTPKPELAVKLVEDVFEIVEERRHILEVLVPRIPSSMDELFRMSPIARLIIATLAREEPG